MAPPNKRQAIVTAAVMVAGALAWITGIWASGLEGAHGFFGLGPLIADANLIWRRAPSSCRGWWGSSSP